METIDVSCSGMAGSFGLTKTNYETSMRAGQAMFERMGQPDIRFGSTECASCRMQMHEGVSKRTLHPIQYLALAYGLMPDLEARLRRPLARLLSE